MIDTYLLSLLIFSPLLGMLVIAFLPKHLEKTIKLVGFLTTLLPLSLAVYAYRLFDNAGIAGQLAESMEWITFHGYEVRYELSVGGLTILLILLTAVIASLAAIASIHIKKEWKGYFLLFLLLELGMLGVFAAENLLLFFVFFEITLIPMFFLIGKWGYDEREKAAFSFVIYNGLGSAVLLVAILTLFVLTGTVNLDQLPDGIAALSDGTKMGLLLALFVAFAVKLPVFPLHTWMLRVHVQAPPSIVMIHSGILLKIGAYGLILGLTLFPEQFEKIAFFIAILGVINLLYGAFLAFVQRDLKMVLAYSSISHMGIVLIGLAGLNEAGIQGAIFQVISHGFISALLFFLIGVLYVRSGTTFIDELGGIAKKMPLYAGFLLAGAMASLGLPGMSGFISELQAFMGLFEVMPIVAAVGTLGIILTAVYLLRAVLNVTFGELHENAKDFYDIKSWEFVPIIVLFAFIIGIGVYPNIIVDTLKMTVDALMVRIGG
ncbi:NADH-quinone oxidoreductase subunit M [Lottiidibacillus patelloidae]|uniref:NADH-quinone oxidoreductase subunit M n=1 Tax=Lottiidibacillus patelloidae TaxID=2670334 RepID=A0A263BRN7_9BACI|nr:NADH-quinone oxidoreductase subunit M [Lottiidibacillus patelloidae]OZM56369.1 NADH-quinone oxidoreductase subunit M [Lottiidibacillus patelloidae]